MTGSLPFTYLGLPIGANPRKLSCWQPVVDMLRKRLTRWKGRYLSLGGRIEFLKLVLSSISLYFLSFFRLPRKVLSKLIGFQRAFLWGGGDGKRSIPWVNLSKVCLPKNNGGLGVKHLDIFNYLSLLGKWRWRTLVDKEACRYNILHSRYGDFRNNSLQSGWYARNSSQWWRDLGAINHNNEAPINWFVEGVRRKVGNGSNTSF